MAESMEEAEMEQRRIDRFWGLDFEVSNRRKEIEFMEREELRSITQERQLKTLYDQSLWDHEMKEQEEVEQYAQARSKMQERKNYLKTLYNNDNASQAIIDYRWSSRISVSSNTDATTATLRRRALMVSYAEHEGVQPLPGIQFESPSVHGGMITGSLDKHFFPEHDDDQQPQDFVRDSSYASPKHLLILSKILESSDDLLANEGGDATDHNDDRIWGHKDFKWEQLQILEIVFHNLVRCSENACIIDDSGEPGLQVIAGHSIGHVLQRAYQRLDVQTQRMVSYTVFGSWVKRNNWGLFSELCGVDVDDVYVFTVADWLEIATNFAAFESKVARRKIRTNKEHCDLVQLETRLCRQRPTGSMQQSIESSVNQSSSSTAEAPSLRRQLVGGRDCDYARWFAAKSRLHLDNALREARLARQLAVGDLVWSQHGNGCRWLPAVVTAIHLMATGDGDGEEDQCADVVSYDLSYLMTHDSFIAAYEDALSMKKSIAKAAAGTSMAADSKQGRTGGSLSLGTPPRPFRESSDAERHLSTMLHNRMLVGIASGATAGTAGSSHGLLLQAIGQEFRSTLAATARGANGSDGEAKPEVSASSSSSARATATATAMTSLYSAIIGSAALSATFLGSTLLSSAPGKLPPTPVRLTAEDWQASITRAWTHAAGEETKESSGEVFMESVATVLDFSTYNS